MYMTRSKVLERVNVTYNSLSRHNEIGNKSSRSTIKNLQGPKHNHETCEYNNETCFNKSNLVAIFIFTPTRPMFSFIFGWTRTVMNRPDYFDLNDDLSSTKLPDFGSISMA